MIIHYAIAFAAVVPTRDPDRMPHAIVVTRCDAVHGGDAFNEHGYEKHAPITCSACLANIRCSDIGAFCVHHLRGGALFERPQAALTEAHDA